MRRAEDESDGLVGSVVDDKYRVVRLLGRGGMGSVYEGVHLGIEKAVALKFLDSAAAGDGDAVARFHREARAASAVESAHIVQIFDTGSVAGRPYLVMERLRGEDLRTCLRRERTLPVATALDIVEQILRALMRAHAAGIVHRDLKPDNVFLSERDDSARFVKVVDFGISKVMKRPNADTLTSRGTVLGTASYMSPEQAQASPDVDGRADLFSVGAILFEMLAGRPPHVAPSPEAVLVNICIKDAPDVRTLAPDVPEVVAGIVARALRRDREERFATASEFLDAVQNLGATADTVRSNQVTGRHGGRYLLAAALAVAAVAIAGGLLARRTAVVDEAPPPPMAPGATPYRAPSPAAEVRSRLRSPPYGRTDRPVLDAPPVASPSVGTKTPRPLGSKRKAPAATAKPQSSAPGGVASALRLNLEEP